MHFIFRSISDDNIVEFTSEGTYELGKYVFEDKSLTDTILEINVLSNKEILFKRTGQTKMEIVFAEGKTTKGIYENDLGLKFDFLAKCQEIIFQNNNIYLNYHYYLDNEYQSSYKIWIIMK